METILSVTIAAAILLFFMRGYVKASRSREERVREDTEKGLFSSEGPKAQHPHIDLAQCIGCGTCASVCPEGDVLAMLGGKAVIAKGYKCVGHSLCAEACPVGAITMVMAAASVSGDMPFLTTDHETTIRNLFIAGELGGLALIKNAVNQGRECIDIITERISALRSFVQEQNIYDVLIVGAGPAGISASLRAIENGLKVVTIERDELGGTVANYPRQKLVMTSPVEFPMYGRFKHTTVSKEELLAFWDKVLGRTDFDIRTREKVENIQRKDEGIFTITTTKDRYRALSVILALGRAGTPRKLGVKGEELPKVMYRLVEADHYINKKIMIVGGGDSAIEAAMGLANQHGNRVTLSYRKEQFSRIKQRNEARIAEYMRSGKVNVVFNSVPVEISCDTVTLDVEHQHVEVPNDFVWIFAGGTPPNDFLRKVGVGFGVQDINATSSREV